MLTWGVSIATIALVQATAASPLQEDPPSDEAERFYRYLEISELVEGGLIAPRWLADGNRFVYAVGQPDETVMYLVDPTSNTQTPLFDTDRLRASLAPVLGHAPPYRGLPFDRVTLDDGETVARFEVEGRWFRVTLDTYEVSEAEGSSALQLRSVPRVYRNRFPSTGPVLRELPSPDGEWLAREEEYDIWLRSTTDDRSVALTTDGAEHYGWRLAPYATQPAWSGSALWSPDGTRLAAIKQDTREVHRIPVLHWLGAEERVEWIIYPHTGGALPQNELFVIDRLSGDRVPVDSGGDPDRSFYPMGWIRGGDELLYLRHDRLMKRLDFMAADAGTGESRTLVSDVKESFIEGLRFNVMAPRMYTPVGDGRRFIWMSERDGWYHLYLYDFEGRLIRRLTQGEFPVDHVIGVDAERGWVYFAAQGDRSRPTDTHLYRVSLNGGSPAQLTEGAGQHGRSLAKYLSGPFVRDIVLSPSKEFFLDPHSSIDRPPRTELRRVDGTFVRVISEADTEALDELGWSPPEEFVVKAADGVTDLYGLLFKPHDFDPSRSYPVIDVLYGGPQVSQVDRTFGGNRNWGGLSRALAELGFVVMNVDARGTPGRGKAFQDVVYRSLGRHEIPDHVAALRQVAATRPYMDLDRVGVHGISFGGYFTARALVLAPDVYHVGVSGLPVMGLDGVRPGPIEPYMERPQDNAEGYAFASNLSRADALAGKLLIITGALDVNAPFSESMKMVDALTRAGKPYDLVVLTDQNHALQGIGGRYYLDSVRRYFLTHLRP